MPTLRRVFLIFGYPNQGKSFLGEVLRDRYGFHLIGLDAAYVAFVRKNCREIDFPALDRVIYQHYNQIFARVAGAIDAWHNHVLNHIVQESQKHRDVAVEGYLLKDCKDNFEVALKERGCQVFQIRMHDRAAVLEPPRLTVSEVAALGRVNKRKRR